DSVSGAGQIQRGLDPAGQIQNAVGGADAATRNSVEDALYQRATARLDPRFEMSDRQMETKLANQGITQGSDAYTRAMSDYSRDKNDAYSSATNDAILAGGQEQSRLFGLGLEQGQFANQAQQQGFGQNLAGGEFVNQAQAQQYGQNANDATFANSAQAQRFGQGFSNAQLGNDAALAAGTFSNQAKMAQGQFGNQAKMAQGQFSNDAALQDFARKQSIAEFGNDAARSQFDQGQALQSGDMALRNQYVSEYLMGRNAPINEAAAISGQSPGVQSPNFAAPSQYNPMGVPVGDYINQNYQAQMQNRGGLINSLMGLGGSLGSAAILCWVAREVYGSASPRWLAMRAWMLTKAPTALRGFYLKHGPAIADFIRDKPEWKARIHRAMEECLV
ncbi:MAG TPA: hypothetical protein VFC26_13665, partial [Verrucomicrobiae bacterium]|nr:hypothetical protein [Verrucomicrobiae bacterium]